jgi:uncharacterized protein
MKKLSPILILSLLFLSIGFSQQEYNTNDLIEMDNGLWTEKFSDEPITGKVYGYYGEDNNPKKVYVGNIRNGKKEGKWVDYYHTTGKKSSEYNFKDGKEDGLVTYWYQNGQKQSESTYKDDKRDGIFTIWYKNGQKKFEWNFKEGKRDGLETQWYENGQKKFEGVYKDGELISENRWNEDGSVKE